ESVLSILICLTPKHERPNAPVCVAETSDARLRAALIHSLGSEGQRIFRTLGPAAKYADCVALLAKHFAPPQSVIARRIAFCQRRQRQGESVHHYVTDLRCLASLCKFDTLEQEMIRDQLAEHTTNPKLREKLLMSPDDTTLTAAIEMAFQLESAAQLTSQLAALDPPPSHSTPLADAEELYGYGHTKIGMVGTATFS
uniref:Retrotransposon gag domain-containing protein n=1 Tax=Myripristis murdjan TaxID=586833 RepID=A0A667WQF1_9TELE